MDTGILVALRYYYVLLTLNPTWRSVWPFHIGCQQAGQIRPLTSLTARIIEIAAQNPKHLQNPNNPQNPNNLDDPNSPNIPNNPSIERVGYEVDWTCSESAFVIPSRQKK